jgi:hypothetical protein
MMRVLRYLLPTAAIFSLLVTGCSREPEYIEAHTSMATALEQPHHARPESMSGHILDLAPARRLGGHMNGETRKPSGKL